MNLTKGIQKSLGPGILLAGAAIGGSHLLSSTTACLVGSEMCIRDRFRRAQKLN